MERNARIDALFHRWDHPDTPGGQVAVRHRGELIYRRCFGLANLEYAVPVKEDTAFHVASVSKQVTVLALLMLQEEGKLSIEDDVRRYLPDLIRFSEPVTLRQMMNNLSGIRDQWELMTLRGIRYIDSITTADVLETVKLQKRLNFAPGSRYMYSNSNFTLLAEIIRRVSGRELPDFAKERIFAPLGMTHTFVRQGHWDTVAGMAVSYADDGTGCFEPAPLNFATWGATSMNTTAQDLLRLLEHYEHPTLCSAASVAEMKRNALLSGGTPGGYGGGLFVGEYKGHPYYQHSGGDAAFLAQVYAFPEDGLQIAITANTDNTHPGVAALRIADLVLGLAEEEAAPPPENPAAPRPGVYASAEREGFAFLEIAQTEDGFAVKQPRSLVPLKENGQGGFGVGWLDTQLFFGENGLLMGRTGRLLRLERMRPAAAEGRDALIGTYGCDELDVPFAIVAQDEALYLRHPRYGLLPLYEAVSGAGDHFVCHFDEVVLLQVETVRAGELRISASRSLDLLLKKR